MKTLEVCAAVIVRNGRILVCTRPKDSPLAGYREFPGGKVEKSETFFECIAREIAEELSIAVTPVREITDTFYDYPDKRVHLHFIECTLDEEKQRIVCNDNQEYEWIESERLSKVNFLPADLDFVRNYFSPSVQ